MKEFWAFVKKEFFHIFRDTRTILILLVMPVVEIVLFGFALSTEVRNIKLAVYAPDPDPVVERIIQALKVNETIDFRGMTDDPDFDRSLRIGENEVIVAFGKDFGRTFFNDGRIDVQVIADATDPNTSSTAVAYVSSVIGDHLGAIAEENGTFYSQGDMAPAMEMNVLNKFLYNPGMKGAYNFVPGVMGLILTMLCTMMASISIVREYELGMMEVLLVSPVKPIYIVTAKAVPYFLLSCFNLLTILLLSRFVLDVPIAGSILILCVFSLLFIAVSLALGLLISTISKTQTEAMLISGMVLLMPTMVLSGMIFPVENMPSFLRIVSDIIPAKWYILAVKKVMIEGLSGMYLLKESLVLCVMLVVLLGVSIKLFKSRL